VATNGIHTDRVAVLFPGQGSSLANAREIVASHCPELYEQCCGLLCCDPFEHALESTRYAQPATFLASIAGWRAIAPSLPAPDAFAGHSLGELSALAAAGVLETEAALRLVILRGKLMADAAAVGERGGMLAVLKGTPEQAAVIASECGVVVANDNAPGQTVLSGARSALAKAISAARASGMRTIELDVSGAFHSPAMDIVRKPFERAIRSTRLAPGSAPVFSGMTAAPFTDVARELAGAVTSPVRWRELMLALERRGAGTYVDVGPDRVLARLVGRNLKGSSNVIAREELGVVGA
jgi:malonyl CoA-acyl carrier protein transacylase